MKIYKCFSIAILCIFYISCNQQPAEIPFPDDVSGSSLQPTPFEYSKPVNIVWDSSFVSDFKKPEIKNIDFDKLPAIPFFHDGFKPLVKPVKTNYFAETQLPDIPFLRLGKDSPS